MSQGEDERGHWAQSHDKPRPGWPSDVRPISQDGLDMLGVGDDGRVYWDGKVIVTEKRITLTFWQKVGGFLTVASAVVVAAQAAYELFVTMLPGCGQAG